MVADIKTYDHHPRRLSAEALQILEPLFLTQQNIRDAQKQVEDCHFWGKLQNNCEEDAKRLISLCQQAAEHVYLKCSNELEDMIQCSFERHGRNQKCHKQKSSWRKCIENKCGIRPIS